MESSNHRPAKHYTHEHFAHGSFSKTFHLQFYRIGKVNLAVPLLYNSRGSWREMSAFVCESGHFQLIDVRGENFRSSKRKCATGDFRSAKLANLLHS
jgi:hypothetical protein